VEQTQPEGKEAKDRQGQIAEQKVWSRSCPSMKMKGQNKIKRLQERRIHYKKEGAVCRAALAYPKERETHSITEGPMT